MLARLRQDFRLAVVVLFSACTVIGVLPFAVYRFLQGNWVVGVVDLLIAGLVGLNAGYALKTGRHSGPALVGVAIVCTGSLLASLLLGRSGLMWSYCSVVASFLLVDRRIALGASLALIGSISLFGADFSGLAERASYAATASIVGLFAFIFAFQTARQRAQLEALASHDPLTGAGNRRLLERDLDSEVEQFGRSPRPVALVVLDLDHFKQVNDRFGHEAGDRVLADFARLLQLHLRKLDRLYRFGGEEFVLLLPGTPPAGLPIVLEKLHQAVHAELRGPGGSVTVSMGAASLHADETWGQWLARADAALYRAKNSGRDRYEIERDPSAHTGSVQVLAERRLRRG
jgi:diguanylate cyclase (GGDEF)-like protein